MTVPTNRLSGAITMSPGFARLTVTGTGFILVNCPLEHFMGDNTRNIKIVHR